MHSARKFCGRDAQTQVRCRAHVSHAAARHLCSQRRDVLSQLGLVDELDGLVAESLDAGRSPELADAVLPSPAPLSTTSSFHPSCSGASGGSVGIAGSLAINVSETRSEALLVSGASHHAWTHPSLPTDQPSVVAARKAVRRQLAAWLGL